jgi:spermidine/putrescine transport system ATP-binding protein
VASFLGDCNLIDGALHTRTASGADFETHDGAHLHVPADRIDPSLNGSPLRVGVRPEKVTLLPADVDAPPGVNYLRGRIEIASFLGTAIQYVVHTAGGEEFTAVEQNRTGPGPNSLGPGREVLVAWDPAHSILVAKEAADVGP